MYEDKEEKEDGSGDDERRNDNSHVGHGVTPGNNLNAGTFGDFEQPALALNNLSWYSKMQLQELIKRISALIAPQIAPKDGYFTSKRFMDVLQAHGFDIRNSVAYLTEIFPALLEIPLDTISSVKAEPQLSLYRIITENDLLQSDKTNAIKKCYSSPGQQHEQLQKLKEIRRKKLVAYLFLLCPLQTHPRKAGERARDGRCMALTAIWR